MPHPTRDIYSIFKDMLNSLCFTFWKMPFKAEIYHFLLKNIDLFFVKLVLKMKYPL